MKGGGLNLSFSMAYARCYPPARLGDSNNVHALVFCSPLFEGSELNKERWSVGFYCVHYDMMIPRPPLSKLQQGPY